jgi:transcriptional regulator with XRE-family HTH domain
MTLEDVGNVAGLHRSAVQKYEKGIIKTVQVSTVELFAKALRCNPAYLLDWVDDPEIEESAGNTLILSNMELHMLQSFRAFTPEGKAKTMEYVDDLAASDRYNRVADAAAETARVFRAAKSKGNAEGQMVDMPRDRLEKLKSAHDVDKI